MTNAFMQREKDRTGKGGLDEEAARGLLSEAEGYLALGLFEEALRRIEAAAATPHLPFEAALLRGECHRERGEFAAAAPCFRRALALRPGDVSATVGLGWCEKRAGNVSAAAAAYRGALRAHPTEAILHYNLACYLSLLREKGEALERLARALEIEEAYRALARKEPDFDPIRDTPAFRTLVGK